MVPGRNLLLWAVLGLPYTMLTSGSVGLSVVGGADAGSLPLRGEVVPGFGKEMASADFGVSSPIYRWRP
jgi:hypothetical protein